MTSEMGPIIMSFFKRGEGCAWKTAWPPFVSVSGPLSGQKVETFGSSCHDIFSHNFHSAPPQPQFLAFKSKTCSKQTEEISNR